MKLFEIQIGFVEIFETHGREFTPDHNKMAARGLMEFFFNHPNRQLQYSKEPILVVAGEQDDISQLSLLRETEKEAKGSEWFCAVPDLLPIFLTLDDYLRDAA